MDSDAWNKKQQKIIPQEDKDFENAKKIFNQILHKYTVSYTQTGLFDATDMRFSYDENSTSTRKFNVEIKTRNDNGYRTEIPLKVVKYCDMKEDTKDDEKLLYISLVNDYEYYVFDLSRMDWNQVDVRNWWIYDYQYADEDNRKKVKTPTYFFPTELACGHGKIPK